MTDRRFSYAELVEMFGGQIPIEAVNILMGAPDDEPLSKVRERITDLAVGWNTRVLAGRLEQREGWRGIESAPRDGTLIQVFYQNSHGHRRFSLVYWAMGDWGSRTEGWSDQWRQLRSDEPTHWMPLPTPPVTKDQLP